MDKLLAWWGEIKSDKHRQHCHDYWKYFSPFFLSVDGMMGNEAQFVLTTLSRLTAAKMDEPILHVKVWVNRQIEISV